MNQKKLNRFKQIARGLFTEDKERKNFHVTFILKGSKIISIGINKPKTHTKNLKFNYYSMIGDDLRDKVGLHSELSAIIRGGKEDYSKYTFLVIRMNANNELLMSKPCPGCISALDQVGYRKIFYSNSIGEIEELLIKK